MGDQIAADFGDCVSPGLPVADPVEKLGFGCDQAGKCVVQLNPGPVIPFPLVGFARKEAVQGCVGNKGWLVESVDKEAIYDVGLVSQSNPASWRLPWRLLSD